jgi:hypothetical protein
VRGIDWWPVIGDAMVAFGGLVCVGLRVAGCWLLVAGVCVWRERAGPSKK